MRIPDKVYDVLKWVGLICLPAVAWLIGTVGADLGVPEPEKWARVINAFGTFIGIIIGVSTISYNKEINEAQKAE